MLQVRQRGVLDVVYILVWEPDIAIFSYFILTSKTKGGCHYGRVHKYKI